MINFKLFISKKGLTLIEVMIALVIFIFPIFATLSSVVFLYKQTTSRNLELLAENLSNYILEDLRGRKFYYTNNDQNVTIKNNLQKLYELLPQSEEGFSDPFGSIGNRIMKYSCVNDNLYDTALYNPSDPNYSFPYVDFEFSNENIKKFYNIFKVEIYIIRYIAADISEPIETYDPYKFIYKIDIVLLKEDPKSSYTNLRGTVQGWKRYGIYSTEVTYHDP